MTTRLIDSVTVTRDNVYKGAARLVVDDNTGTTGDGVTGEEYNEMLEVE